jgi:uncharacterized protein YqgV (UPF0045/DUF77 family)
VGISSAIQCEVKGKVSSALKRCHEGVRGEGVKEKLHALQTWREAGGQLHMVLKFCKVIDISKLAAKVSLVECKITT